MLRIRLHICLAHTIYAVRRVYSAAQWLRPSHGPECRRLGLTHTFMGEPQRGGRPCKARTHTQYRIYAVRRHDECIAPRQWLRPSPVAHRLVTRRVTEITPPPPRPPTPSATPYPFLVRVEVGRDRHAQKAGCGSRAVAIDSAAVTRAYIPTRHVRKPRPSMCAVYCCLFTVARHAAKALRQRRQPRPCKVLDLDAVPTSTTNAVPPLEVLHARRELERVRKGGESAWG